MFLGLHFVIPKGTAPLLVDLLALGIIMAGFVLAVIAMFGLKAHGSKGLLRPALVGLVINGLFLLIFFTNASAAAKRARERRTSPPPVSPQNTESTKSAT